MRSKWWIFCFTSNLLRIIYIYCCRKWIIYVGVFLRLKCLLKGRITTSKTTIIKNVIMLEAQVNISVASILIRWETFCIPDVNFWKINSLVAYYFQKPLHDVMGFKRELNGIIMDIALQWYVSPSPPTIFMVLLNKMILFSGT